LGELLIGAFVEQGDLILVRFPFSNMVDYKIRPALVVSNNRINRKFDLWACPITSKEGSECIAIKNSLQEGKLDKESYVKTSVITNIEKDLVMKKIGKINGEKTGQIIGQLINNLK